MMIMHRSDRYLAVAMNDIKIILHLNKHFSFKVINELSNEELCQLQEEEKRKLI